MLTGRGAVIAGGFLTSSFPADKEWEGLRLLFSDFLTLAFLPREEKKLLALLGTVGEGSDRMDDGVRVGHRWFWAKEGYGSGGGAVGTVMSSISAVERSVAREASRRLGKVTSEMIDEAEVCLGCPPVPTESPEDPKTFWMVER